MAKPEKAPSSCFLRASVIRQKIGAQQFSRVTGQARAAKKAKKPKEAKKKQCPSQSERLISVF